MLREVQRVGISEDADGVVDAKGVEDAEGAEGSRGVVVGAGLGVPAILSVLAAAAGMGDGSGVPKAGTMGATGDAAIAGRLVNRPSSRNARTAARAAEVFATFLLEKAAF